MVELSPDTDKAVAYLEELKKLLSEGNILMSHFYQIVGNLRFAALCLPVGPIIIIPLNIHVWRTLSESDKNKKLKVH